MTQEVTDAAIAAGVKAATESPDNYGSPELCRVIYLAMREHDAPADVEAMRALLIEILDAAGKCPEGHRVGILRDGINMALEASHAS